MATKQTVRRCRYCQRPTVHLQQKPSHFLHLVLSVITAGLWLFVWLGVSLLQGRPQCTECGGKPSMLEFTG